MHTTVSTKSGVSSAAGVLTIPPNDQRVGLILGSPAGRTTFVIAGAGDGSNVGPAMGPNATPLQLTAELLGRAVGEAVTLVDSAGAQQTFGWIEILHHPHTPKTCKGLPGFKE